MAKAFFTFSATLISLLSAASVANADVTAAVVTTPSAVAPTPAPAGAPAPTPSAAATVTATTTTKNSDTNYLDDGLSWEVAIPAKLNPTDASPIFCLPAGTRMMGRSPTLVTTTTTVAGGAGQAATNQYLEVQLDPRKPIFGLFGKVQGAAAPPPDAALACPTVQNPQTAPVGVKFYVAQEDLALADYRGGLDYGALVVPFKIELSGKHSFAGSSAVGGYLGYRIPVENTGISFSPILFAGASNISTSVTTSDGTTSQTLAGLSYGGGVIATIKGSFQVGLVLGFDHVDSTTPYAYNDRPWLSLEIGYSFAQ